MTLSLETVFVALRVFGDLSLAEARHRLAGLRAKVQEWPQVHGLFVEVDPHDTPAGLLGKFGMHLLTCRLAASDGGLDLNVPNKAIRFRDGVIARVVNLGLRHFERAAVVKPRQLQQFTDEEVLD